MSNITSTYKSEQMKGSSIVNSVVIILDQCITGERGNEGAIISYFNALWFDVKLKDGVQIIPGTNLSDEKNFEKWILGLLGIKREENKKLLENYIINGVIRGFKILSKTNEESQKLSLAIEFKYSNSMYPFGATLYGAINSIISTAVKGAGNETSIISVPIEGGENYDYEFIPPPSSENNNNGGKQQHGGGFSLVNLSEILKQSGARGNLLMKTIEGGSLSPTIVTSSSTTSGGVVVSPTRKDVANSNKIKKLENENKKEQNEKEKKAFQILESGIGKKGSSSSKNNENNKKMFEKVENGNSSIAKEEMLKAVNKNYRMFIRAKKWEKDLTVFFKNFNYKVTIGNNNSIEIDEEEIDFNGIFAPYVFNEKSVPQKTDLLYEKGKSGGVELTEKGISYFKGIEQWIENGSKTFITTLSELHTKEIYNLIEKVFEIIAEATTSNNTNKLNFLKNYKRILCEELEFDSEHYKIFYAPLLFFYFLFSFNTILDNIGNRNEEAKEFSKFLYTMVTQIFQFVVPYSDEAVREIIAENAHSLLEKTKSEKGVIDDFKEHMIVTLSGIEKAQKTDFVNKNWKENAWTFLTVFDEYFFGQSFTKQKFIINMGELTYMDMLFCSISFPKLLESDVKYLSENFGIKVDIKNQKNNYYKCNFGEFNSYNQAYCKFSSTKKSPGAKSSNVTYGGGRKWGAPMYKEQTLWFLSEGEDKSVNITPFGLAYEYYQSINDGNIIKSILENVCGKSTNLGFGEKGGKDKKAKEIRKEKIKKAIQDNILKEYAPKGLKPATEKKQKEKTTKRKREKKTTSKSSKKQKSSSSSKKKEEEKEEEEEQEEVEEEEEPVVKSKKQTSFSTPTKEEKKATTRKRVTVPSSARKQQQIELKRFADESSSSSSEDDKSKSDSSSSSSEDDDEDKMDVEKQHAQTKSKEVVKKIAEKPKRVVEFSSPKKPEFSSPKKQQKKSSSEKNDQKQEKEEEENNFIEKLSQHYEVVLGGKEFIAYFNAKEKFDGQFESIIPGEGKKERRGNELEIEKTKEKMQYVVLVFKLLEIHKNLKSAKGGKQKNELLKYIQDKLNSMGNLFQTCESKEEEEVGEKVLEIIGGEKNSENLRSIFGGTEISKVFESHEHSAWLIQFFNTKEDFIFGEPICRRIRKLEDFYNRYDYAFDILAVHKFVKLWYNMKIRGEDEQPSEDTKNWQEVCENTSENEQIEEMVKYYTYEKYMEKISARKFTEEISEKNFVLPTEHSEVKTPDFSPMTQEFIEDASLALANLDYPSSNVADNKHQIYQDSEIPPEPPVSSEGGLLPADDEQEQ